MHNVTNRTIYNERHRLKIAFRRYITGKYPGREIGKLVGASHFEVKEWLCSHMRENMNWNNYGRLWVVVHLAPLRLFDIQDDADLRVVWYYKNLFPIYKDDSIRMEGDLRLGLTILQTFNEDLNPMIMKLSNKLVDEITIMNRYL